VLQKTGLVDEIGLHNGIKESTFTVRDPGESIALSPDGGQLYVLKGTSAVSNIAVVDVATESIAAVLPAPSHCVELTVSPDGKQLYEVVGAPGYGNIQVFGS
jgi:DNA-binding beta-propeller fold protein YncE